MPFVTFCSSQPWFPVFGCLSNLEGSGLSCVLTYLYGCKKSYWFLSLFIFLLIDQNGDFQTLYIRNWKPAGPKPGYLFFAKIFLGLVIFFTYNITLSLGSYLLVLTILALLYIFSTSSSSGPLPIFQLQKLLGIRSLHEFWNLSQQNLTIFCLISATLIFYLLKQSFLINAGHMISKNCLQPRYAGEKTSYGVILWLLGERDWNINSPFILRQIVFIWNSSHCPSEDGLGRLINMCCSVP